MANGLGHVGDESVQASAVHHDPADSRGVLRGGKGSVVRARVLLGLDAGQGLPSREGGGYGRNYNYSKIIEFPIQLVS